MKKFLIIALVALVLITGGMFTYTYTTATATIAVSAPESDFAEITAGTGPTAPTVFGKFTGTWPSGTLFTIDPHEDYTGDLVIKVYFVNTGQLIRYYHHLNMALELQDSTGAQVDEQSIFQCLNLQNAVVEFNWANGTGTGPYKVELTGGSFRLHGWKTLSGGSTSPQIWAEVTQR
jgi:hypothetical protein